MRIRSGLCIFECLLQKSIIITEVSKQCENQILPADDRKPALMTPFEDNITGGKN